MRHLASAAGMRASSSISGYCSEQEFKTDGKAWTEVGKVKASGNQSELTLTRFVAGAWIPGQSARYVRVGLLPSEPASLSLRHVEIWGKD